ncbi:D-alanine--D-alanine ligase [Candidatus Sumerlaeota bacterium]|nr:D-alanine--D-alanine ligase [Candidatus Sumerlaeota bacterium]
MTSENRKCRIAVLCGGRSGEHEVSLLSARSIIEALDPDRYDLVVVGIQKDGQWRLQTDPQYLLSQSDARTIHLDPTGPRVVLPADPKLHGLLVTDDDPSLRSAPSRHGKLPVMPLDVVFPVLHGPYGEDGTVQGLLELAGIAYVGAGVLGSAVGMDKDVMKRLLRDAGIPIPRFQVVYQRRWLREPQKCQDAVWDHFSPPVFVKPANLGSSVGITKVQTATDLGRALDTAFQHDTKVLVEEAIEGREIECSVLGDEESRASLPGEIIPSHEFYSYEAKYLDPDGAQLKIPADLPEQITGQVRQLALATYRTLCCEGMARVDFFLANDGRLLVSEINTIPGFTAISMYPKLWEASDVSFAQLLDRLIELAFERQVRRARLKIEH